MSGRPFYICYQNTISIFRRFILKKRKSKQKICCILLSTTPEKHKCKQSTMFFKKHFHEVVFISNPSVTQFTADNLYKYFLPPCGSKSWFLIMYMHILRVCMSVYYVRVILRRPEESIRPPRTGVIVSKYVGTWNQTTVLKNNKCSHPLSHLSSQRSSTDPPKHHRLLISSAVIYPP